MDPIADENTDDPRLTALFGASIVEQAKLIDVVDLNLDEKMTACIAAGVAGLKQRRGDVDGLRRYIESLQPGEQLLLCMWIMEMELGDKLLG